MKLQELIKRIDKSEKNKDPVSIYEFAQIMDIHGIWNYEEQSRLVAYWIGNWYCTDTYVGYRCYFFDNEPVAVSSKLARKSDETIEWLSKEAFHKVKDYILTFITFEEDAIDLADLDEEIGDTYKLNYYSQLFEKHKKEGFYKREKVIILEGAGYKHAQDSAKIKFEDGHEETVRILDIDFPYHLT